MRIRYHSTKRTKIIIVKMKMCKTRNFAMYKINNRMCRTRMQAIKVVIRNTFISVHKVFIIS